MKTLKNNDEIIKKAFEDWDKDALELFLEEYGFYIEKALWLKDKQTKDKIKKHGEKRMKEICECGHEKRTHANNKRWCQHCDKKCKKFKPKKEKKE